MKNIACDYVIDEQADGRPRIENPKLDLSIYGNIIYDEGSISSNEKRESFFLNDGTTRWAHGEKMQYVYFTYTLG